MHHLRGVVIFLSMLALAGCDCLVPTGPGGPNGPDGPNGPGPNGATLVSLVVTGQNQLKVNATTPLTATANYSDGTTANVTTQSTWASSAAGICSVNPAGVATGVGAGTCIVSATYTAVSGHLDIQVTVDPDNPNPPPPGPAVTLTHMAVSGPGSITIGQTVPWQATAFYSNGTETNVTATANWSSAAPGIAGVVAGGMVTGVAVGNTTIQAAYEGRAATGAIVVSGGAGPPTVTSLSVTGNTAIQVGQTSQLQAIASMSDGTSQNVTATATWASDAGAIASVSSTGLVTGNSPGSAPITATFQGVSAGVTMQVTAAGPGTPTVVGLIIQGTPCGVVGGSSQLQAIAQMSDGSTQNRTATATWTTGNGSVATVTTGLVQCVAVGTTSITAAIPGPHSANVPVTVVAAPVTRQLIGIRADIEGRVLTGNGLVGLNLSELLQDPLLTVNVFALYSDGSEENVTALAALTTSDPLLVVNGPGVVNAAGVLVQALVNPSHYINVTYQGFTVIANVVIDVPVLGKLPITGLLLNGPLTNLSVGTKLPDLMAVLSGPGVAGTVNLLIPVGTAGVEWNIRPKLLTNCGLLAIVCGTVNTALQGLGNLANGVVTIVDGTVQSLNLGALNAILAPVVSLLGGVLQVDVSPIVNGVVGPITTIPLPL